MRHIVCLSVLVFSFGPLLGQDKSPKAPRTPPDGVYAVLRESTKEKDLLPLKDGEAIVVDRHRYAKQSEKEQPRFLVVRTAPDVKLDLVGEPKVVKEGKEITRILLQLRPDAAKALERLTTGASGKQITIVIGGEVVTTHKIREVIKGGKVQITSCAPGGAKYLLEQLQSRKKEK